MHAIILSSYPLSLNYRRRVENKLGAGVEFVSLNEIKNRGLVGLAKYIFSLRERDLYLAVEEETAAAILPTLKILVSISRCRRLFVILNDLRTEKFSRFEVFFYLIKFVFVNLNARRIRLSLYLKTRRLHRAERISVNMAGRKKNLIYIKSNLWFGVKAGGSVGHIAGVINGFLRKGWNVTFYGAEKPFMVDSQLTFKQGDIPEILAYPPEINCFVFDSTLMDKLLEEDLSGSIIYQRLSIENITGVVLSRKYNLPLIIEYNGSEVWVSNNWGKQLHYQKHAELCEEVCLQHAHLIVTISDVLRDELISRGIPAERIVTYPNCIDEKVFDPDLYSTAAKAEVRQNLGFSTEDRVCTFVGTFGAWHGVEFLAHLIVQLINQHETWLKQHRVKFLLIGDGSLMQKVKEILSGAHTDEYFVLTGLIEQHKTPLYLAASDILLSPHVKNKDGSKFFGSPTKLFEYMAMGKPIVASRLEQIEQVLSSEYTVGGRQVAALFEPNNDSEFKIQLMNVIENYESFFSVGTNARAESLARYTWAQHVDKIIEGMERI